MSMHSSNLQSCPLAAKYWQVLSFSGQVLAQDSAQWQAVLTALGIVSPQAVRRVTEAALLGGVIEQGVDERLVILSDGAPPVQCASSCLVLGACRARPASVTGATRANNGRTSRRCNSSSGRTISS